MWETWRFSHSDLPKKIPFWSFPCPLTKYNKTSLSSSTAVFLFWVAFDRKSLQGSYYVYVLMIDVINYHWNEALYWVANRNEFNAKFIRWCRIIAIHPRSFARMIINHPTLIRVYVANAAIRRWNRCSKLETHTNYHKIFHQHFLSIIILYTVFGCTYSILSAMVMW